MNATRSFTFRTIAIGLALATLIFGMSPLATAQENRLSAKMIQDKDYPSRSNTGSTNPSQRAARLYLARLDGIRVSLSWASSPPVPGLTAGSYSCGRRFTLHLL